MTKTKPIWVFVAGPYRSGSTTQYLITEDIVQETKSGKGIGYHTEAKLEEFDIEGNKPFIVCKVFEYLPDGFRGDPSHGRHIHDDGRIRAVVSVRDPRDIAVSMRTRAQDRGDFFDFERVITGDFPIWLGNVEKWIRLGPDLCHWSRFEDFTLNLLRETRAIAEFLGIDLPDKLAKDIAGRYTIPAQQERKQRYRNRKNPNQREHSWLPSIPGIKFGTSGHNSTWLNGPEIRMVEQANRGFMERFGYLEKENDDGTD